MLEAFFRNNKPVMAGRVLLDNDDEAHYEGMDLPHNWSFFIRPRDTMVKILNRAFEAFPDERFYALAGDDMTYTSKWDTTLSDAASFKYLAWGDDGRWGPKLCPSFFIGGDLVRHIGWLAHPDFGHLYTDTVWWMIAKAAGLARYRPDVRYTHPKILDQTFRERAISGDKESFDKLRGDGISQLIEKAAELGRIVHNA